MAFSRKLPLLLPVVPVVGLAAGFNDLISVSWNLRGAITAGANIRSIPVASVPGPAIPGGRADDISLPVASALPGSTDFGRGGPQRARRHGMANFPAVVRNSGVDARGYASTGYYRYHPAIYTNVAVDDCHISDFFQKTNLVQRNAPAPNPPEPGVAS